MPLPELESTDTHVHAAFGLRYRSHLDWLPLPHTLSADSPFDVDVRIGDAPATLPDAAVRMPYYDIAPGRALLKAPDLADILAEDGCRARISPKPGADPMAICNLLFGGVTGALLIQRGVLALHGASVVTPGGAAVICGRPGAGKSTLSLALSQRGIGYIDDNIAALDAGFDVQPGVGFMRLTDFSRELFALGDQAPGYTTPQGTKRLHTPASLCTEPRRLRHVYLLDRSQAALETPLLREKRLDAIRANTFTAHLIHGLGADHEQFRLALALAGAVSASVIGYPPGLAFERWVDAVAGIIACR